MSDLIALRPAPIFSNIKYKCFNSESNIEETIKSLLDGHNIIIDDYYSNGLILLKEINNFLNSKHKNHSFNEQREYRAEYRRLSQLILLEIKSHTLKVKKAPEIGWLKILYPEFDAFHLSFPHVQGLNSAWQWYQNGIVIPGLRNKIHPYFGVYFPTRFEHLIVFDTWLKHYHGTKKSAYDIGIGCGVLSFLMLKHGFQKSYGSDINPNAIIGLTASLLGTKLSRMIELQFGNLFCNWDKKSELIVFNPPWIPLPKNYVLENLDEAMYYHEHLFTDFFEEAQKRLLPDGRILLLFSNIGQITNMTNVHPIEKELQSGGRYILEKCYTKSVKNASEKTKRDQHWRSVERVELWELKLKSN